MVGNKKIALSIQILDTDRMKNKEPISGAISTDVSIRSDVHGYDKQNKTVVELIFKGYSCNYVQVIDMVTARKLMNQLEEILPPSYVEL